MQIHVSNRVAGIAASLAATFLVLHGAVPAGAQTPASLPTAKVAVIDVQRILTDSEAGKSALAELKTIQDGKLKEIESRKKAIDEIGKQITEGRLTLSEERLAALEKDGEDKAIALKRFQDDAQRELDKSREKVFDAIEKKVLPIIDDVGREMGVTLIFNKFQSGLLFAQDEVDITDLILQRFDESQAGEG